METIRVDCRLVGKKNALTKESTFSLIKNSKLDDVFKLGSYFLTPTIDPSVITRAETNFHQIVYKRRLNRLQLIISTIRNRPIF